MNGDFFFFQNQALFCKLVGHFPHQPQRGIHILYNVLYLFLVLHCVSLRKLEGKEWKKKLSPQKAGVKYNKNTRQTWNELECCKKGVRFSCLFLGFRVELQHGKNPAGIFIKNEAKTCCIKWTDPIFSLIVSFLKTDGGSGDWGDGGA